MTKMETKQQVYEIVSDVLDDSTRVSIKIDPDKTLYVGNGVIISWVRLNRQGMIVMKVDCDFYSRKDIDGDIWIEKA